MRPVNLLPGEHRPRRATGARSGSAYVVLGVLAGLLLLAVGYVLTANRVSSAKERAAAANREAAQAKGQSAALGAYGSFAKIKQTRELSVTALASARFDWERFMRELSRLLPHDTWLTDANASVTSGSQPSSSGASNSSSKAGSGVKSAGPSAELQGCARRQPSVARLMVHLRHMHGVSDVSLADSQQQDAGGSGASGAPAAPVSGPTGTGGASGCGHFYQFDLTVTFDPAKVTSPPTPGVQRVPATLGGGG